MGMASKRRTKTHSSGRIYAVTSKPISKLISKFGPCGPSAIARTAVLVLTMMAAAGLTGAMSPAVAQNTAGLSGAQIERVLTDAGLSPTMAADAATGAPVASAQAGPIKFWVRSLDCGRGVCSTLVFFANWELGRAVTADDYKRINRYNDRQVFGRAYVIEAEQSIGVDYVVEMQGGVSMDNVTGNVSRWTDVITAFIENFRADGPGS